MHLLPCINGCVSLGSMGSAEPMEFQRKVPEPMDFQQIEDNAIIMDVWSINICLNYVEKGTFCIFFWDHDSPFTFEKNGNPWIWNPKAEHKRRFWILTYLSVHFPLNFQELSYKHSISVKIRKIILFGILTQD